MTDYGRTLQFGVFVTPTVELLGNTFELAALADETGLDFVAVQDHPYQAKFLDSFSLMGTLLARTERVRVFPDVACLPLRPPAVMAKAAASLDVMSGGRFELALGAGAFWEAIGAMGGDVRTPGQAATAVEEAVEVIRLMWSGERAVRSEGEYYRLDGVHPGPVPAHPMGIWLGVGGPRLLRALGRSADGWVPSSSYFPPEVLPGMHAKIDAGAADAGRDPSSIVRAYNIFGRVGDTPSDTLFEGTAEQWVSQLTDLAVETGMDTFVFGTDGDDPAQVRKFATDVAPAVRAAVDACRGVGTPA
ncbi:MULTISPECIES: LLM class flavin-dependent oxidoreductase [unclassified Rhodococcus (in: high G+C Gram-positive bacteria)]|uniref:LLM class flavin-dependent oxidoreductase n=1 Tax=unclassified Rhodococcus (in: high G+C Gram-positive bacteria) TaxID=192944 RepID=UPI00163A99E7|nr:MULTISPECIES: LLM class flavin-dependent oxidoreductase [unclassified Rhodococcus (in: high G+C Gram-positive bacteria)]MBC2639104.1 LLM class flavin-dependent oxidoreductase [Rhodococcus sp. 3A]MBC2896154.1 LLM class flavin-dependent oxidoreductase [Rhodococcus sp. 4CII]